MCFTFSWLILVKAFINFSLPLNGDDSKIWWSLMVLCYAAVIFVVRLFLNIFNKLRDIFVKRKVRCVFRIKSFRRRVPRGERRTGMSGCEALGRGIMRSWFSREGV